MQTQDAHLFASTSSPAAGGDDSSACAPSCANAEVALQGSFNPHLVDSERHSARAMPFGTHPSLEHEHDD